MGSCDLFLDNKSRVGLSSNKCWQSRIWLQRCRHWLNTLIHLRIRTLKQQIVCQGWLLLYSPVRSLKLCCGTYQVLSQEI